MRPWGLHSGAPKKVQEDERGSKRYRNLSLQWQFIVPSNQRRNGDSSNRGEESECGKLDKMERALGTASTVKRPYFDSSFVSFHRTNSIGSMPEREIVEEELKGEQGKVSKLVELAPNGTGLQRANTEEQK
ncbi:hypothetical protein WN55_10792 [Dufourea novaeangliae]|uniref:Uncharacterized protein n=1 Tax=Dufourea novaeangliae TaxID=178035 RepID=A0A154PA38_DUFNO|nr:hypothetical protein WN55_10792 [Dufourea novaeangliae]